MLYGETGIKLHNLSSLTARGFIDSYNKFCPICTEMSVTELDVAAGSAAPSAAVLATQANQYAMFFKCFVKRSLLSGRGKIVNVSKDGLNDQYTFQANLSSSLWDSGNNCRPAFFAVAGLVRSVNSAPTSGGHTVTAFALGQNYPNPLSPATLIRY